MFFFLLDTLNRGSSQRIKKLLRITFSFSREEEMKLLPPAINFDALKAHVMTAMESATRHAVMNCRDLIGGDNRSHFESVKKSLVHLSAHAYGKFCCF